MGTLTFQILFQEEKNKKINKNKNKKRKPWYAEFYRTT
jgi:hypothetical protein